MSDQIKIKTGDYLLREGDVSDELYFLNEGTMAVFKRKADKENQIGTIYSGELVGEMSFLDGEPRSASVKALSDCHLTVIPRDKLEKYISRQPSWYRALVKTLVERLRKANARVRI